ncbi:hypothetical protein BRL81_12530, partial [Xanthomonas oryzae pv. oryzae]
MAHGNQLRVFCGFPCRSSHRPGSRHFGPGIDRSTNHSALRRGQAVFADAGTFPTCTKATCG